MAPAANRSLNPVEQKIHQACSANDKKMLAQKEIDTLVPDVNVRVAAINFLLSTGMLKMMSQDGGKQISYKAVMKKEMEIKKEMGGDENMVLSHIQSAANEGIWTKHLKGKTELHQTIINRCLKSLEQRGLIKAVKSVKVCCETAYPIHDKLTVLFKYPTRKIYMMSHLEPSVEVTGGPWYSENELDTEFIKMLASACLRFIQDKSFPKSTSSAAPLFPISKSSSYPTSKMIHSWLLKSRLSEQELGVEHVEMLLDTLVFDGEIERLPAYGAGMWDMGAMDQDSEDERKEKRRKKKAKKEKAEREQMKKGKGKKRARQDDSSEDSDEDEVRKKKRRKVKEESDDSDDHKRKSKSKKARKGRYDKSDSESDAESYSDSDLDRKKSKRRKTASKSSRSKSRSKSKRRSSTSSSSESDDESDVSESSSTSRKTKKKRSSSKSSSRAKTKSLFDLDSDGSDADGMVTLKGVGSANVYRAVRQERVSIGLSQAPCGRCPVFEFCHESGPVNPRDCTYYGDWLLQGVAEF
ncbi:RNA polymerase Rpc34 subunit-domain-containing protein [Gautieria morchelliformis]|nr:RNA polymerase Rpc34 subunit-domain-containing protein [Gautieria morchelliformis]